MDEVSKAFRSVLYELILRSETKKGMQMLKDMVVKFQNKDGTYKPLLQIFKEAAEIMREQEDEWLSQPKQL